MAKIYPNCPTPKVQGESKVLDVLQKKLGGSWHVFHEPSLAGDNPDLILFSPYYGMLVLEVKDYKLSTIQHMSIDSWTIQVEGQNKKVTAPLKQVREYAYKIISLLEQSSCLLNNSGEYQGRLKFPVVYSCWFTNLSLVDVVDQNINKTIPEKWIFTADDFYSDNLELKIVNIIREKFSISGLTNDALTEVQKILYPEIAVEGYETRRKVWFESLKDRLRLFPSLVDEILFIGTEIRDKYSKGTTLDNIYVYYVSDKFTKNGPIAVEIKNICSAMGINCSLNDSADSTGNVVRILSLDNVKSHTPSDVIFIMDLSLSGLNEERELSLKGLFNGNSQNIYITSSDLS